VGRTQLPTSSLSPLVRRDADVPPGRRARPAPAAFRWFAAVRSFAAAPGGSSPVLARRLNLEGVELSGDGACVRGSARNGDVVQFERHRKATG
jgi:hypothetical protein